MSNTGIYETDSEPEGSRYNDSDEESLVDVDSPADGYFERRQHPQTTFVPSPATQPRSEEDKAREAAAERLSQQQQQQRAGTSGSERQLERERPPSHHSQPRSPVWAANEDTPLLDAGPAGPPPDYAAATADRRGQHGREGSYGSLSDSAFSSDHPLVRNGLLNEQGVFGQRSEPQSMRDSLASSRGGLRGGGAAEEERRQDGEEESGFVRRQWDRDWNGQRRWTRHFRAKRLITWLAVIGTLVLILLVSGIFEDAQDNGKYPTGGNGRNAPEKTPSFPSHGGDGSKAPSDPTKDIPMPPHKSTSQCIYSTFSAPEKIAFPSPSNFSFLEFIENPAERALFNDRISGTIQISAAPPSQSDAIVVWVSVAISGSMQLERLRRVSDEEGVEILFPDVSGNFNLNGQVGGGGRWAGGEGNCLDFSVAVLVRNGTKLGALEFSTANFDVLVDHGVFDDAVDSSNIEHNQDARIESTGPAFAHLDTATIMAVRGTLRAEYFSSRSTHIETGSSKISGTYALRDLLSVKSISGAISINVVPKNAGAEDPEHPADFRASSNSGGVDVGYLTDSVGGDKVPERDYRVRVETGSSSIKGSYILGSDSRFVSNSGGVELILLPYFADKAKTLHTSSSSGKTKLRVLSPYTTSMTPPHNPRADVLGQMHSTHKSYSGALHLAYPDEWEGVIDGESVSGSISIRGEDVEMLVDEDIGKGIPGYGKGKSVLKHVTARKGYGDSRLDFSTSSGGVDVLVGRA